MRAAASSHKVPPGRRRRTLPCAALVLVLVAAIGLGATSCSSGTEGTEGATSATTGRTTRPPTTAAPPTTVPGTEDCGEFDALAGWPTTTTQVWTVAGPCIVDAFHVGTPARMVIITPGDNSSGQKTAGGYDLPTRHVRTWIVIGPERLQQTKDLSEDGGSVTVQTCTHLELPPPGGALFPSGCTS